MTDELDPAVYGEAWRPMLEAPREPSVLVLLLVPNRPDIKVVKGVRFGDRWLLESGAYLPDDQPPIGWMPANRPRLY